METLQCVCALKSFCNAPLKREINNPEPVRASQSTDGGALNLNCFSVFAADDDDVNTNFLKSHHFTAPLS